MSYSQMIEQLINNLRSHKVNSLQMTEKKGERLKMNESISDIVLVPRGLGFKLKRKKYILHVQKCQDTGS